MVKRRVIDLKVVDLKAELESRHLDTKGLKACLIERLQKALIAEGVDEKEIEISDPLVSDTVIDLDESITKTVTENPDSIAPGKDLLVSTDGAGDIEMENSNPETNVPSEADKAGKSDGSVGIDIKDENSPNDVTESEGKPPAVEEDKSKSAGDTVSLDVETGQVAALDVEPQQSPEKKVDSPSITDVKKSDVVKKESAKEDSKKGGGDNKSSDVTSSKEGKPTDARDSRIMWVSNLNKKTNATKLKKVFTKYGSVMAAKIISASKLSGCDRFGLISMRTVANAKTCVEKLNETDLDGSSILVEMAPAPKRSVPPRLILPLDGPGSKQLRGSSKKPTRGRGIKRDPPTRNSRIVPGARIIKKDRPGYDRPINRFPYNGHGGPRMNGPRMGGPRMSGPRFGGHRGGGPRPPVQYRDHMPMHDRMREHDFERDMQRRAVHHEGFARKEFYDIKMMQMDEKRKLDLERGKLERAKLERDMLERDRIGLEQERLKLEQQRHYEEMYLERERHSLELRRSAATSAATGFPATPEVRAVKRPHDAHDSAHGFWENPKKPITDANSSPGGFDMYSSVYARPVMPPNVQAQPRRDDRALATQSGHYSELPRDQQPYYAAERSPSLRIRPPPAFGGNIAASTSRPVSQLGPLPIPHPGSSGPWSYG